MAENLGGSIAFVPLIAVLECIAIAKAFGKFYRNMLSNYKLLQNVTLVQKMIKSCFFTP